jgi:hypothetical protein
MNQWTQWIAVVTGIAFLGMLGAGCSEAPEPDAAAVNAEDLDVVSDAAAEARVEEATAVSGLAVSPETQARIDAYTADLLTSLKRSADFLAAQESFSFRTDIAFDVVQANGQVLEFGGTRDYLMRRPDRLRIESIDDDGGVKQLFFDGTSILIDMPNEDAYVQVEKPGTLYAAMDYLVEELGAPSPLEDFTSENFAAGPADRIVSGFYVQRVMLEDRVCEHLAWRTKDVDVQLWVQEGDEPVPCRVVITYKKAEAHPQFAADFHLWDFAPDVDDELFAFTPPESAERLQVQSFVRELRDDMEGK